VRLRQILRYIGVSDANMEEGNFRCDANVSLRPAGSTTLGTKVEVKNMNSFRAVHDALAFEQRRQAELLDRGDRILQETRGWVDDRHVTVSQRSKEEANDYRYFPSRPAAPEADGRLCGAMRRQLPELPERRRERFAGLGLSEYEAATLTETRERADYFESTMAALVTEGEESGPLRLRQTGRSEKWRAGRTRPERVLTSCG
jgi:aspartyl-tRNA(Asn)/glutamyl-tRNA(Gln) amidotransferase subunit B